MEAAFVALVLFAISLPVLSRQARRENDRRVFVFLAFALALKLACSMLRHFISVDVYQRADATQYHQWGVVIAHHFRAGDFHTGLASLTSTNFIRFFTGLVYTVIGPNELAGFVVFSWLGFWGLFFFYRAYIVAVPEGRKRDYRFLVFLMPSLLFWPSSIGKESWMMFSLGIATYGAAVVCAGRTLRGAGAIALGLWLALMVRPHMAGLVAVALAAAYLIRPGRRELGQLAPVAKIFALAALVVVAVFFVSKSYAFLRESGISTSHGLTSVLGQVTERTGAGGSEFKPSALTSPARLPVAVVTVLFRPFIFEANNKQSLAAALEGSFLIFLFLIRIRWVLAAVRSIRRQPYVAFAVVYVGLFLIAFSSIANFGLLVRERTQLYPFLFVLLTIPPRLRGGTDKALMEDVAVPTGPTYAGHRTRSR
jgi:hypothetical protein